LGGAPTPFDEEVDQHYERHAANITKAKSAVPTDDADAKQGAFDQKQVAQSEARSNLSESGTPDTTPAKPLPIDGRKSLADTFKNWDPADPNNSGS
jgi:hypothetical protein